MQTIGITSTQLRKLNWLLDEVRDRNPFYTHKWRQAGVIPHPLDCLDELSRFPLTTRAELVADQAARPPFGTNLTCSLDAYKRVHRSSGTTRAPLWWADTPASWLWLMHCSRSLYRLADVTPGDRVFFAMPFGALSGPWIMYEGACSLGCACVAGATADGQEQVRSVQRLQPTVLVAKPPQLFQLADAAEKLGINIRKLGVNRIIAPGAALDDTRERLQRQWAAPCFDRYGLTEAGSVAGECPALDGGMHLLEDEFIAEVVQPDTGEPAHETGELVLTNLGRPGQPIIRYRTGDLVRLVRHHSCPCGRSEAMIVGGVHRTAIQHD